MSESILPSTWEKRVDKTVKAYKEAREEIVRLNHEVSRLKLEVGDVQAHTRATIESTARMAEKMKRSEAELEKALARNSKDKEKILRQVDAMRAQVAEMKGVQRVATMSKFTKYFDAKGAVTGAVPIEVVDREDWIGALIASHQQLLRVRLEYGRWAGVLEDHATCRPMAEGCKCPSCSLRREIVVLADGKGMFPKKIEELEQANKSLRDENRDYRKERGPRSEKEKRKAADTADLIRNLQIENDKLKRSQAKLKAQVAALEANVAKAKTPKKKSKKEIDHTPEAG